MVTRMAATLEQHIEAILAEMKENLDECNTILDDLILAKDKAKSFRSDPATFSLFDQEIASKKFLRDFVLKNYVEALEKAQLVLSKELAAKAKADLDLIQKSLV